MGSAQAQDQNYAKRLAYKYAIRCVIAGSVASRSPVENPGGRYSTEIRSFAAKAHSAAFRMGAVLGYSEREVNGDLDQAQQVELPMLMRDPAYFADTKAACVKLGFMRA